MRQLKNFKSGELSESVEDSMEKYKGMDEDQLVDKLLESVGESKKNGMYSSEELTAFVNFISPHLDEAQKERLESLVKIINE